MTKISILLSYYDGSEFIDAQIQSILQQKGELDLHILIRNDGSDSSALEKYKSVPQISVFFENNIGIKRSFFKLISLANDDSDFYCFCDQDDVWMEDKLITAVNSLRNTNSKPALYFSKTFLVDNNLNDISIDHFENGVFSFSRNFIKNNAVGCTMVFNNRLFKLLKSKVTNYETVSESLLHDHILYILCNGVNGSIIYDSTPHIKYRQHNSNVIGDRTNFLLKLKDNGILSSNHIRKGWAKEIELNFNDVISPSNLIIVNAILNYDINIKTKLHLLRVLKFSPRSFFEKVNIFLLILLNKF